MIRIRSLTRHAATAAVIAGIALLSYAGVVVLKARAHQQTFDASSVPEPAAAPAPASAPAPLVEGMTIGEIRVDRIGLKTVVTEGETDAILDLGAGHLADTPWLGQPGNVVLAGHRDTVFRPLEYIRAGDVIDVTGHSGAARYRVTSTKIVAPTDLSVLDASDDDTLTLITCFPFVYVGHAPQRFIVRATAIR